MVEKPKNEALQAEEEYRTTVEEAYDYVENFDILETITNVGNDEVFTPRKTADMMLDSLPEEVWHNPDYKWLNPATKNGIFEREIAIRLDRGLADVIPDVETRRKHILQKMIFSIGQTKFTANVARRTIYYCSQANRACDGIKAPDGHYVNGYAIGNGSWFNDGEGNIKTPCTDHEYVDSGGRPMPSNCTEEGKTKYHCRYCGIGADSKYNDANQRETYAYEFIHVNHLVLLKHLQKRFFEGDKNMKFDIIIGNPPYQLSTGGAQAQATPIYNKFVEQAIALNPKYLCMIIPSRWFAGGLGLDSFRDKMLNDTHIKNLTDFTNSENCFPSVAIKGGVCYFLWEKDYDGPCNIVTNDEGSISRAVRYLKEPGCDVFIRRNEAISILRKVLSKKMPSLDRIISGTKPFDFPTTFVGQKEKDQEHQVALYGRNSITYVALNQVNRLRDYVGKYKVFISGAYGAGEGFPHQIINVPFFGDKNTCCTETYIVMGPFETEKEARNLLTYLSTKFLRFLVMLKKASQHTLKIVYEFVPLLDLNKSWTDKELYELFGINDEEIAFIDSMVREMNI